MKLQQKLTIIGLSSITLGLIGLTPFAFSWANAGQIQPTPAVTTPAEIPLDATEVTKDIAISGKPVRLEVPAANINITIIDGAYNTNTGEWTLTDDKAQFALPTVQPNDQSGNTLIYGHNTWAVFAALHNLKQGAEAKIYTENGHIFTYKLRSSEVVDPTNTAIFDYEGAPQLTLQTCTGVWSEARKFFYFDLVTAE